MLLRHRGWHRLSRAVWLLHFLTDTWLGLLPSCLTGSKSKEGQGWQAPLTQSINQSLASHWAHAGQCWPHLLAVSHAGAALVHPITAHSRGSSTHLGASRSRHSSGTRCCSGITQLLRDRRHLLLNNKHHNRHTTHTYSDRYTGCGPLRSQAWGRGRLLHCAALQRPPCHALRGLRCNTRCQTLPERKHHRGITYFWAAPTSSHLHPKVCF